MTENESKRVVTKIAANPLKAPKTETKAILNVAAYCRVSTDDEDQVNSYITQKEYYTDYIKKNPKWRLVDIYADEGISGTLVRKRDDFLRMIADCEKGKIDLILIKSVSRFARNIVDSLKYVRMLRKMGIAIFFEEQHINSLTEKSETFLGMYSVMAQSESENISANVKWGISKRMQKGTYCCNMNMLGYRRDKGTKKVYIVPEEAEIVREIFSLFLNGKSVNQIKSILEGRGAKTFRGSTAWSVSTIQHILENEKYTGDILFQKTYSDDCISKIKKVNTGELDMYLVKNDHEAIIGHDIFQMTKREMARRNSKRSKSDFSASPKGRLCTKNILSDILVCDVCGSSYRRKRNTNKNGAVYFWRCLSRLEHKDKYCDNSNGIEEETLKAAIWRAITRLLSEHSVGNDLMRTHYIYLETDDETSEDLFSIESSIRAEREQIDDMIGIATSSGHNKEKYNIAISDCSSRIQTLSEQKEEILSQIKFNDSIKEKVDRIIDDFEKEKLPICEYNDALVRRAVESIRITKDKKLIIAIKGGVEITEPLYPNKGSEKESEKN